MKVLFCSGSKASSRAAAGSPRIPDPVITPQERVQPAKMIRRRTSFAVDTHAPGGSPTHQFHIDPPPPSSPLTHLVDFVQQDHRVVGAHTTNSLQMSERQWWTSRVKDSSLGARVWGWVEQHERSHRRSSYREDASRKCPNVCSAVPSNLRLV